MKKNKQVRKIATKDDIKVGDTVIALIEEYAGQGEDSYDATVQIIDNDKIHVCYLSGYKSRNDVIAFDKILAKVDKRHKWVTLDKYHFEGKFKLFNADIKNQ